MPRVAIAPLSRVFILVAALLLPSCIESENPLSDLATSKPDERLLGIWKDVPKDAGEKQYWFLFIGKPPYKEGPPGLMTVVSVGNDGDNRLEARPGLHFFPTSLGRDNYANLVSDKKEVARGENPKWDKSKVSGYQFCKYAVEDDKLTIWFMDENPVAEAINKGQLKGKVEEKGWLKLRSVTLTGTGRELSQFLSTGGDKLLFPDDDKHKSVFRRVK
jgi:hypothetical protein